MGFAETAFQTDGANETLKKSIQIVMINYD